MTAMCSLQETRDSTLCNETLKEDFKMLCQEATQRQPNQIELIDELFKELLSRVINTTMNSLLHDGAMMDRITQNKGVDADISLRDKLKVYAVEKQSCIKL